MMMAHYPGGKEGLYPRLVGCDHTTPCLWPRVEAVVQSLPDAATGSLVLDLSTGGGEMIDFALTPVPKIRSFVKAAKSFTWIFSHKAARDWSVTIL